MVLWDFYVLYSPEYYYEYYKKRNISTLLQRVDFDELSEEYGFTMLHKIVSGIEFRDLDIEVQRNPHNVDKLDRYGRSPLWYAVVHRNAQFVRHLLERGANPNLGGGAIFLKAIECGRLETVELLITFGFNFADLTMDDFLKSWPGCFSQYTDDLRHVAGAIESLLITHWVDVNKQSSCGTTLLMCLCWYQKCDCSGIELVIRRGAELELRDSNGQTALFYCFKRVLGPNPDAFLTLAHAGARLDVQDHTGSTVLHHVVLCKSHSIYPPLDAIKAKDVDVSQFDLDARNEDGYTAFDLLKKRNGITWESYYIAKRGKWWYAYDKEEIPYIRGLESLFHQIQDSQGIPLEQQYPPLAPYLCEQPDDKPIPGAWPL